ncbi:hypothetical protein ALC57_03785 [Trachymyrmex cornetzi]|uniref:Uncharacterized protein n=1 Tax=Trachymyrmex cornetzi TaxID=471704 RepID=A0A195EFS5_9HYME|nr:hypothetical protein ALC57_03785 [Trachymyrmex cornetzi]
MRDIHGLIRSRYPKPRVPLPCLKASPPLFSRHLPSPSFLALLFLTNLRASRSMPAIAENRVASRARPDIPNTVRITTTISNLE